MALLCFIGKFGPGIRRAGLRENSLASIIDGLEMKIEVK